MSLETARQSHVELSLVFPAYNDEANSPELYHRVHTDKLTLDKLAPEYLGEWQSNALCLLFGLFFAFLYLRTHRNAE